MYDSTDSFDLDKFIQPLITRCSTNDTEIDVDELRSTFQELLIKEKSQNDQID